MPTAFWTLVTVALWAVATRCARRSETVGLELVIGGEVAVLALHRVGLAWCTWEPTAYGFPLPWIGWAGSSLEYTRYVIPWTVDVAFWAALGLLAARASAPLGRGRLVVAAALADPVAVDLRTEHALVYWQEIEFTHPVDAVVPWDGRYEYTDPRCPVPPAA